MLQVGAQHALGRAGRAGRVDDAVGVPGLHLRHGAQRRGIAVQRGGAEHAAPAWWRPVVGTDADQRLDLGQVDVLQPLHQPRMAQQHLRPGIAHDMGQQVAAERGVERAVQRAEVVGREPGQEHRLAVGQPDADGIALPHTQGLQRLRGGAHTGVRLAPGPLLAVLEHREHAVRRGPGPVVQQRRDHAALARRHRRVEPGGIEITFDEHGSLLGPSRSGPCAGFRALVCGKLWWTAPAPGWRQHDSSASPFSTL
jgi:hypothetical protein